MVTKKALNLLKGHPSPSLLPLGSIYRATQAALDDPEIAVKALTYGPDAGFQPLRDEIAGWMQRFYRSDTGADKIAITGGASQNLACVLQVYSDPVRTKVWMVAPCYFLACRIFNDSGLEMRAVPEGEEGVDLGALQEALERDERERGYVQVC